MIMAGRGDSIPHLPAANLEVVLVVGPQLQVASQCPLPVPVPVAPIRVDSPGP